MPIIFNANDSCIFNLTFDALFYINNYSQPLQFIAHYNSASVLWNTSVQAYLPIVANNVTNQAQILWFNYTL